MRGLYTVCTVYCYATNERPAPRREQWISSGECLACMVITLFTHRLQYNQYPTLHLLNQTYLCIGQHCTILIHTYTHYTIASIYLLNTTQDWLKTWRVYKGTHCTHGPNKRNCMQIILTQLVQSGPIRSFGWYVMMQIIRVFHICMYGVELGQ